VCYDGKKKKKKKNCGCYETGSKGFLEQYFFLLMLVSGPVSRVLKLTII